MAEDAVDSSEVSELYRNGLLCNVGREVDVPMPALGGSGGGNEESAGRTVTSDRTRVVIIGLETTLLFSSLSVSFLSARWRRPFNPPPFPLSAFASWSSKARKSLTLDREGRSGETIGAI